MWVPGIGLGYVLARYHFRGRDLLNGLLHVPLVIPPVVTGYLLLVILGNYGFIGGWLHDRWGLQIAFTRYAAVLASAVVAFPFMVRSVRQAVEMVDPGLEQAARCLGAGRFTVFRRVTLPLAFSGIISGTILAFARSLGEFGATMTFAGNLPGQTRTIPLAIYSLLEQPNGDRRALLLVLVSVALSVGAVIGSEVLSRRALAHLHHQTQRGRPCV
jgi:molybdate transport system permease protein